MPMSDTYADQALRVLLDCGRNDSQKGGYAGASFHYASRILMDMPVLCCSDKEHFTSRIHRAQDAAVAWGLRKNIPPGINLIDFVKQHMTFVQRDEFIGLLKNKGFHSTAELHQKHMARHTEAETPAIEEKVEQPIEQITEPLKGKTSPDDEVSTTASSRTLSWQAGILGEDPPSFVERTQSSERVAICR